MSLTLLFAGTGTAGDGPTGVVLVSIIVSPSPGVIYVTSTLTSLSLSPGAGNLYLV